MTDNNSNNTSKISDLFLDSIFAKYDVFDILGKIKPEKFKIDIWGKNLVKKKLAAINWGYSFLKDKQKGEGTAQATFSSGVEAIVDYFNPLFMVPAGEVANKQVDKNYNKMKNYVSENPGKLLDATALTSPVFGPLIVANKFKSLFNKAKLYIPKNQKADITVPSTNELLNVSNSAAVQQAIKQNNAVQVIETKSEPIIQQDSDIPGWLSSLYSFLNVTNVAVGGTKSVSAYPIIKHTGGKVPGRGDIMAILKGGETVRTEVQEKELQEQMLKKHFESFAPLVSGQGDEQQNQQNGAFSSYAEKKSAKPVLQDRTRHDEEMIIGIVADAWKTNRSGFRRILKSC